MQSRILVGRKKFSWFLFWLNLFKIHIMSDYLGRSFARLIPVLLILVMVVVVGRYFFGIGRVDIQELALYVHALIFLGCAGWAYSVDEHVRVDIFYRNSSPAYKKAVNTF